MTSADSAARAERRRRAAVNASAPVGRPERPREHGTMAGVAQHRYRGEDLCEPCRLERNRYHRERKAASKIPKESV